uniref:DUF4331 domain-containing protein n=1 Tax=Marinobacterium profundum TaxID=1714300 RepID=UPI0009EA2A1C|nr:DUF4331 domain-containing protein [Marinobacterium profundum]
MKSRIERIRTPSVLLACVGAASLALASSHMDAPLITLDDAANTADVYAFRSNSDGMAYLTTALSVYPFEEPGIGPNKYNFDDRVRYSIHVATGDDLAAGRPSLSYHFRFNTAYKTNQTILQSYLGVIDRVGDDAQNLTQSYRLTQENHRTGIVTDLTPPGFKMLVPPNNQGIATPLYNIDNNGENPARDGVALVASLDAYTAQTVYNLPGGYRTFAGQRDDGFYGDIQSIFDLLQLRSPGVDAQGGYNVHTVVLDIPLQAIGGADQVVGVYASTSRQKQTVLRKDGPKESGDWVQVARQGNPLFNEALVAIADKDLYNRSSPEVDAALFAKYAEEPELAALLNDLVFGGDMVALETGRTDIAGIFIPDLIKVDLSTAAARLAGGGADDVANPDDAGFSRLSVFGGDALSSSVQAGLPGFAAGTIPGGWPNGRRFGDDVVDIAVTALISDLRNDPLVINGPAGDNVDANDIAYNKVFPYAATPLNGRNHGHGH